MSDNVSVGKNWLSVIALPQYIVDQGLADIVMVVFLENSNAKWLADMLFGQLQTRRKKSTLPGSDSLLTEFERIRRKNGKVQGYAVNPLSCADFVSNLKSLAYEIKPPKQFGFSKRNKHFSAACRPGAKERLPDNLQSLIGEALPSDPGMVRICSAPPKEMQQNELPFEERFTDVPAIFHSNLEVAVGLKERSRNEVHCKSLESTTSAPLVAAVDQAYAPNGPCVVSHRNMAHVGFNGIEFR